MREIEVAKITDAVKRLCIDANYHLGEDILRAFSKAEQRETTSVAKAVLSELRENAKTAAQEEFPLCQDTGLAVVFIELGQEVYLIGGDLQEAIQEGVRQGYQEGYLRKSICHPFTRKNTGDNTPAVIHMEVVRGSSIRIQVATKGGGSENMSRVTMLTPAEGIEGVKKFVVNRVLESGANPCPPIVVGVGIGGTFEKAALLSKKALLREIGAPHLDPEIAAMEASFLEAIERLGIGPAGYGGITTAFAVHIELTYCHIASLPVAVNINCHSARHQEITL
ncbi:putative L(+)-tartrate dehydratase subunit alpha [Gammaproteobacteria bacterium]